MGRDPRHVPADRLVEVTTRTMQSRLLLRPSRELNEIIIGILGRAQGMYGMRVCATIWLSNHFHALLCPKDPKQLAKFMQFVNANVAKEVNLLHDWKDHLWARRYKHVRVSDEIEDQEKRLRYILRHGTKENLVGKPAQWPGVHCVEALLTGQPLRGLWYDRREEYEAWRRGERPSKYAYATEETLKLDPMPCWRDLPTEEVRQRVATMVREIEQETAERHKQARTHPLGSKKILKQDPHGTPANTKRSPAPRVHASCPEVWKAMQRGFFEFRDAYRQAADELKAGNRNVEFPQGSFPPALPFVPHRSAFAFP